MGTYTTNWNLFKPASTDFVDVNVDVDNNMTLIDTIAAGLCRYDTTTASDWAITANQYTTQHKLSNWQNDIRSYSGNLSSATGKNGWEATNATPSGWADFTPYLINGFTATNVAGFPPRYRVAKEDAGNIADDTYHLEFSGRVAQSGYAVFAIGTQYLFANCPMNGPAVNAYNQNFRTAMGNSPASATNWNAARVVIGSSTALQRGQFYMYRDCGTSPMPNETNGSSENYFCLDGIRVRVSRSSV